MISSSLSSHFTSAKLSYFRLLCNCKVKRWESGAETHLCPAVSWCTLQWTLSLHYPSPPLPPSAPSTSFSHPLSSSPLSSSSLCSQGCRRGEWTWRRAETNIKKKFWPLWADSLQAAPLRETPLTVTFCGPLWVLWVTKLMMKASGNQIYLLQQTYCCKYKRSENGSLWNTCTDFKESWNISEVLSERSFSTWML